MKKHSYLILIFLIIGLGKGLSQTIMVQDQQTLEPIPFANVTGPNNTGTVTDAAGYVDLIQWADTTELIFSFIGYETRKVWKYEILEKNNIIFLRETAQFLDQVVISASKIREKREDVAYSIESLDRREIENANVTQTPDLLTKTNGVTIQKSQLGGGSPIIRGFEANRVLLVVDGVRMNNAIYRSGHLQNALTVDAIPCFIIKY